MLFKVARFSDINDVTYTFFVEHVEKSRLDWGLKRYYSGWRGPEGLIYHTETPYGPEMIEEDRQLLRWGILKDEEEFKNTSSILNRKEISFAFPEQGTLCPGFIFGDKFKADNKIKFKNDISGRTGELFLSQHINNLYHVKIDENKLILDGNGRIDLHKMTNIIDTNKLNNIVYPYSTWISLQINKGKICNNQYRQFRGMEC